MIAIALLVLGVFAIAAFVNWRLGITLTPVMMLAQDAMRKLTPDQPQFFILFVAILFAAAAIRAILAGVRPTPLATPGFAQFAGVPFLLFVVILAVQGSLSFIRFGSPVVPLLGAISFLTPFFALPIAFRFVATGSDRILRRFLWTYMALASIGVATVALQAAGMSSPLYGEVGVGIRIYDLGTQLEANSGVFRASEIAAWHAATAASVAVILGVTSRRRTALIQILTIGIVVLLLGAGVLTGRRKFIILFLLFLSVFYFLMLIYDKRRRVAASVLLCGIAIFYIVSMLAFDVETNWQWDGYSEYDLYLARTHSVLGDVGDRFFNLGVAPISWAYQRFGLLGIGLGVTAAGVDSFVSIRGVGGAGEGGLGKLMLELGAPGLFVALLLGFGLTRVFANSLKKAAHVSSRANRVAAAGIALLVANIGNFVVATQTYSDLFVLIFLGIIAGAVLAAPKMANLGARSTRRLRPPGEALLSHAATRAHGVARATRGQARSAN